MKKQIFPLQRNRKKLKQAMYEHLGNGYYRDMRTGKIIDKYLNQGDPKRSGTKLSWTKFDFTVARTFKKYLISYFVALAMALLLI
jgi:hypothetical protein